MLVQEDNPGIDFEYSMPSGAVKLPGDDRYDWSVGDWSACSGVFKLLYFIRRINTVDYKTITDLHILKSCTECQLCFDSR